MARTCLIQGSFERSNIGYDHDLLDNIFGTEF